MMIRRYKVTTLDRRPQIKIPKVETVVAYDAKDAFNQVDLLIDRSLQMHDIRVIQIVPYPFTLLEWLKNFF